MSLNACLEEQIGWLVHPTARAQHDVAARHRFFIETRLAVGFAALAILPVYLATGHVPSGVEAAVLACLVLPFVAVAVLSARGRLFEAELISAAGWVGLAATLVGGGLAGPGTAAGLLVLVPLEASFGESTAKLRYAAGFACLGAIAITAGDGSASSQLARWVLALAALQGAALCVRGNAYRREAIGLDQERSRKDRQFADAVSDVVIRFDGALATVVNPRAAPPQLGLDADELAGRGFFDRVHMADRPAFLQIMGERPGAAERIVHLRLRTSLADAAEGGEGGYRRVELRIGRAQADDDADPRARFTTMAQVRAMPAEAIDGSAAGSGPAADDTWRDRLIANISHELRTPLNAIIGFSEMLASDTHLPQRAETRREYAQIIHASGQHLLAVVNSMLDLSKIDAGKFVLAQEPFDVGDLLAACCDMMRLKAEQARVDVVCRVEPERIQITADKRACRQIVLNLLSNALKFTPEYGRATVEARLEADWLTLVVADTGIGMLAQDMARLGDPFFQVQNASDRRFEGTGLGLSVVTGFVGLHGGSITAESAPGEGTRMIVRLPRETVAPHAGKVRIETVSLPSRSSVGREPLHPKVKKIA